MPKKNAPLTVQEMEEASDIFFPLFDVISSKLKDGTVEDKLKIMENVAKLGHKLRSDKLLEEKSITFGFNKEDNKNA